MNLLWCFGSLCQPVRPAGHRHQVVQSSAERTASGGGGRRVVRRQFRMTGCICAGGFSGSCFNFVDIGPGRSLALTREEASFVCVRPWRQPSGAGSRGFSPSVHLWLDASQLFPDRLVPAGMFAFCRKWSGHACAQPSVATERTPVNGRIIVDVSLSLIWPQARKQRGVPTRVLSQQPNGVPSVGFSSSPCLSPTPIRPVPGPPAACLAAVSATDSTLGGGDGGLVRQVQAAGTTDAGLPNGGGNSQRHVTDGARHGLRQRHAGTGTRGGSRSRSEPINEIETVPNAMFLFLQQPQYVIISTKLT